MIHSSSLVPKLVLVVVVLLYVLFPCYPFVMWGFTIYILTFDYSGSTETTHCKTKTNMSEGPDSSYNVRSGPPFGDPTSNRRVHRHHYSTTYRPDVLW